MHNQPFVDFIIVGAMKSGTTSLSRILKNHEEISFCSTKEPQFFSESPDWCIELPKYQALFSQTNKKKLAGEASTGYTMFPEFNKEVWRDIYTFNPQMKIIYIMRDPIKRIVSHYTHNYMRGYIRLPLHEALLKDTSLINRTRYYMQIRPYIETFGRDHVFLTTFERFVNQKEQVLGEVANFLGLEKGFTDYQEVYTNKAREEIDITVNRYVRKIKSPLFKKGLNFFYKQVYGTKRFNPEVTDEMEKIIWNMLEQDVDNIEKEIGREIVEWPSYLKFKRNI